MHDNDQLEWLAFCYITDELSAGERAEFEERLTNEQAAREAVAEAVLLTGNVRQACTEPVTVVACTHLDQGTRAWLAIALATAAVAMFAIFLPRDHSRHHNSHVSTSSAKTSSEFAQQWLHAGEELASASEADFPFFADFEVEAEEDVVQGLESPSWMLAALTSLSQEGSN